MMKELILKNRSYRRFQQERPVADEVLRELIDLARLSPTGHNRQALRYFISNQQDMNEKIYSCLAWAGYLKDWGGPPPGERPAAYIVMLKDGSVGAALTQDQGFAGQSILLGAVEKGLGGCFLVNVGKQQLTEFLALDEKYEIAAVIALGYPKEKVVLDPLELYGDVKYWRDDEQVHHVPKLSLDDIILNK
ncbi:MAG TPA: nitroreductase family protein [Syntrophomonas sp.]|jgi:nitroreductase|nr:nitroreductase family protein [Syntrophomonas sp.]